MSGAPPVCLVAGTSGSGKTTLVEKLLGALRERGCRCATAKHHRGTLALDRPGKDSWRHRRAGAAATFLVTPAEVVAFYDNDPAFELADLARLCPPRVDLLLVEGFKGLRGYPRIEVVRQGVEREFTCDEEVLCVATDRADIAVDCPVLSLDEPGAIADLLVRRLRLRST